MLYENVHRNDHILLLIRKTTLLIVYMDTFRSELAIEFVVLLVG